MTENIPVNDQSMTSFARQSVYIEKDDQKFQMFLKYIAKEW